MINGGATHIAVATDHAVEPFATNCGADYKTGAGIEPDPLAQFPLLEDILAMAEHTFDTPSRDRLVAIGGSTVHQEKHVCEITPAQGAY